MSVVLVGAALGTLALQLVVLPLWLLPADPAWGWLVVPLVLTTFPLWSLVHEAIHGLLLRDRPWNDRLGRLLAVGYGAPFGLLKTGHLLHHRYSRGRRERAEVYDPSRVPWWRAALSYYPRLVGGLYLAEVATLGLAFLPVSVWRAAARRAESPDTVTAPLLDRVASPALRTRFRLDAVAVLVVYAGAFVLYGRHGWLLLLALAGRAFLVSVADNSYHYATRLDAPREALNLRLPRVLETFILAFNLHSVHHRHPGLPWHRLRATFVAERDVFHRGWFRAVGRQVRGPVPLKAFVLAPLVAPLTSGRAGRRRRRLGPGPGRLSWPGAG